MAGDNSTSGGKSLLRERTSFNPPKMGFEDLEMALSNDEAIFNNSNLQING